MKSWGIYIAIAFGVYLFSNSYQADRDGSGAIVSEGEINAFNIRVGDCFNDAANTGGDEYELSGVAGVPCAQPHDNEVYAVFDVGETTFPGDQMSELAFDHCLKRFEQFVGRDYQSSSLDIMTLYPTSSSWERQNDREVICAAYDMNLAKLEGSVGGSAL